MDAKTLDSNAVELQLPKNDLDSFNFGKNAPPLFEKSDYKMSAPTSSTFFKNIIFARDTTRGGYRRFLNMGELCICSFSIVFILIILMAIPVIMIVIGAVHLQNCKIQKMIPIWLIVFGSLAIVKNISTLFQRIKSRLDEYGGSKLLSLFDSFLGLFLIIWFICGNVWTYPNYTKYVSNDPNSNDYCHVVVINFAFWIITAVYILIALACIIFCCTICLTILIPSKQ